MKNKVDWFKKEKNEFFKDKPKKKKTKQEFKPEKALKTVGGLALIGIGTAVALDVLTD